MLSRLKERAIVALVSEETIEAAAVKAGVAASTLYRWKKLPHFKAALSAAQWEVHVGAIGEAQAASGRAIKTLIKNLSCGIAATENSAAEKILERAAKGKELIDLAAEVGELRETVQRTHAAGVNGRNNGRANRR
jgi:hypothetical protein